MTFDLGIIGTGEFAVYLVEGVMRANPDTTVIVSPRGRAHALDLQRRFGHTVADDNAEVVARATTVLAATRPAQFHDALAELPWRDDQLVISVAAGVDHTELTSLASPATAVLCMPTNSAMLGESVVPMFPANERARRFLTAFGEPVAMPDERAFESSAVLGAYFGWLLALMDGGANWLAAHDVPADSARTLMAQVFRSAAAVAARRDSRSLSELANELRLPGGITEHGLIELEKRGSLDDWQAVMTSVLERLGARY
ncbi:MAG: hypothetical protein DWQ08_11365 [Proteobacteria bacterium]|nr:MAG: hypothetical protein DWQ08_11365 [Pseudomonadota bacterium]